MVENIRVEHIGVGGRYIGHALTSYAGIIVASRHDGLTGEARPEPHQGLSTATPLGSGAGSRAPHPVSHNASSGGSWCQPTAMAAPETAPQQGSRIGEADRKAA